MSYINYGEPASAPMVYPRPMTQIEIQKSIDNGLYDYSYEELSTNQYGTP